MGRNVTLDSKRTFHDIKGILKGTESPKDKPQTLRSAFQHLFQA